MKVHCPCCKSSYTATATKTDDNGIIGPGYKSWIKERKCICLDCGVLFLHPDQLDKLRASYPKPNSDTTDERSVASKAK